MNPSPMPFVTSLYAGLIALLLVVLALRVSLNRRRAAVGIGDGGDAVLARAVRAHANAVEWALPVLLLLLVTELVRAPVGMLHVAGIALVAARVLHAIGLSSSAGYSRGRFLGILLNWLVLVVLALYDIVAFARYAMA